MCMELNASELNDLASVDIMFAEMMAESGVNPIPSVCDNMDMTIFDQDDKTVAHAFLKAEENMNTLIQALDLSMNMENKDAISKIIDNLKEKQQLIAKEKQNFSKSGYNYLGLYTDLKKVQNKLGLNLNCPEMNALALTKENFNIDQVKQKVINASIELDDFLKQGESNFQNFLKDELDLDRTPSEIKEKIKEVKRKKEQEKQHEQAALLQAQQTQTFTPKTFRQDRSM